MRNTSFEPASVPCIAFIFVLKQVSLCRDMGKGWPESVVKGRNAPRHCKSHGEQPNGKSRVIEHTLL